MGSDAKPREKPLLFRSQGIQAVIEIDGAISRQHLLEIRLHGAFALTNLLGPAFFGSLPIFGGNLGRINQRL